MLSIKSIFKFKILVYIICEINYFYVRFVSICLINIREEGTAFGQIKKYPWRTKRWLIEEEKIMAEKRPKKSNSQEYKLKLPNKMNGI